ncbi:MAG: hypothetical protein K2X39_09970 [Silvanigrellaceae bacterium]|nr:hypothetical protein [Silvanigrellaceae bacterium]
MAFTLRTKYTLTTLAICTLGFLFTSGQTNAHQSHMKSVFDHPHSPTDLQQAVKEAKNFETTLGVEKNSHHNSTTSPTTLVTLEPITGVVLSSTPPAASNHTQKNKLTKVRYWGSLQSYTTYFYDKFQTNWNYWMTPAFKNGLYVYNKLEEFRQKYPVIATALSAGAVCLFVGGTAFLFYSNAPMITLSLSTAKSTAAAAVGGILLNNQGEDTSIADRITELGLVPPPFLGSVQGDPVASAALLNLFVKLNPEINASYLAALLKYFGAIQ